MVVVGVMDQMTLSSFATVSVSIWTSDAAPCMLPRRSKQQLSCLEQPNSHSAGSSTSGRALAPALSAKTTS